MKVLPEARSFGEKKVPIYNYLADFGRCRSGFDKAVSFCCDYVFESNYLKTFRTKMLKSLEMEVEEKFIQNCVITEYLEITVLM